MNRRESLEQHAGAQVRGRAGGADRQQPAGQAGNGTGKHESDDEVAVRGIDERAPEVIHADRSAPKVNTGSAPRRDHANS